MGLALLRAEAANIPLRRAAEEGERGRVEGRKTGTQKEQGHLGGFLAAHIMLSGCGNLIRSTAILRDAGQRSRLHHSSGIPSYFGIDHQQPSTSGGPPNQKNISWAHRGQTAAQDVLMLVSRLGQQQQSLSHTSP